MVATIAARVSIGDTFLRFQRIAGTTNSRKAVAILFVLKKCPSKAVLSNCNTKINLFSNLVTLLEHCSGMIYVS